MTSQSAKTPMIGLGSDVDIVVIVDGLANYIPDLLASLDGVLPRTIRDRCRHEPNPYNAAERLVTFALPNPNPELHRRINRFIEERPDILGSCSSGSRAARASSRSPDHTDPIWENFSEPAIFHGREECINQATRFLLSAEQRQLSYRRVVLTIHGEGGVGKSTASRAVLAHPGVVEAFSQRRAFIACDAVESIEALESLLLDTLGLAAEGSTSAAQLTTPPRRVAGSGQHARTPSVALVSAFLRRKPALLVLDNFECVWNGTSGRQVVEQFVEELSASCALILTIRGAPPPTLDCKNLVLNLGPLPLDSAKYAFLDFGGMVSERARHEAENEPALGELLERMEGHALSIALLGRQAKSGYGLPDLLRQYHKMTSGAAASSSSQGRSASLSASIRVSLDMQILRETQGALDLCYLMARLPDGADNATTEAIFADDATTVPSPTRCSNEVATRASADLAMEARSACFRAGLIAWSNEQRRWRMLAPIREFIINAATDGGSPLNEAKLSLTDIDSRIFCLYRDRLAQDAASQFGRGQRLSFSLHADLRNIDQAMLRALSPPQPPKLLATLTSLCKYLYMTVPSHVQCLSAALEHTGRGKRPFEAATGSCEGGQDRLDRLRFLASFGKLARRQGHCDKARRFLEEASRTYGELGNRLGKADTLWNLGDLAIQQGRCDEARHLLEEASIIYDEVDNRLGKANSLRSLGELAKQQGRCNEAQRLLGEASRIYDEAGNRLGKAYSLGSLGDLAMQQGRYDEARRLSEEASKLFDEVDNRLGKANSLRSLGDLARQQNRCHEARDLLEEAGRLYDEVDDRLGKANSLRSLGVLAKRQGQCDEARRLLGEASAMYDEVDDRLGKANTLRSLGDLARQEGRFDEALHLLAEAGRMYDAAGSRLGKANSLRSLGDLARRQGQCDEARRLLGEASTVYDELGSRLGKASCLQRLGDLAKLQGHRNEARHLLEAASRMYGADNQVGEASRFSIVDDLCMRQTLPGTVASSPVRGALPALDNRLHLDRDYPGRIATTRAIRGVRSAGQIRGRGCPYQLQGRGRPQGPGR